MKKTEELNLPLLYPMSEIPFRFKQFSILQEKSAMKVGTDGVLLGAWAKAENPKQILDIGTGTGLIALMLAQRFPNSEITGIEPDKPSFEEAKRNAENSPFCDRLNVLKTDLQDFETKQNFDLIVSNPPFFKHTHKEDSPRNNARQQRNLTLRELISYSVELLSEKGILALILPFETLEEIKDIAKEYRLNPQRITKVKGNQNAEFKRVLIQFTKNKTEIETKELAIEISRNNYTREYIELTREFYLKM